MWYLLGRQFSGPSLGLIVLKKKFETRHIVSMVMIASALGLSACQNKHAKTNDTQKPPAMTAPLAYAKSVPQASISLSLPEAIKSYPDLHSKLYTDGTKDLNAFLAQAVKSAAELKGQGFTDANLSKTIGWHIAVDTPHLVSAYAEIYENAGGAHPNSTYKSLIWDKAHNQEIKTRDIFRPGADLGRMDAYLCHAIGLERARRMGEPRPPAMNCPHFSQARLVLMTSNVTDRASGVIALYAPYEIGAYAEGAYEIRLPLAVIKPILNPKFADDFAGLPPEAASSESK